jgi:hypothetical protein
MSIERPTAQTPKGTILTWPIRAQGVEKQGVGPMVAFGPAGSIPADNWPKGKPQPTARQLAGFRDPREHPYVIIEVTEGKKTVYRTPRISNPVTIVTEKKAASRNSSR